MNILLNSRLYGAVNFLKEFASARGTYASVHLLPESNKRLYKFCRDTLKSTCNPQDLTAQDEYHITTTYTRNKIYLKNRMVKVTLRKEHFKWELLGDKRDNLVLIVKEKVLDSLSKEAINKGATWDYPTYKPHINVCNNFSGSIKGLPLPDFNLTTWFYVSEPLKED
jgi:hypothetical protein